MPDVYKVGVQIALQGDFSNKLGAFISQLGIADKNVIRLNESLGRLKLAIGGAAAAWAGDKTLKVLGTMVDYGDKLVHQQQMMRIAGTSNAKVAEATATAYKIAANIQTTTAAENLKHLRELRYAFGSLGAAEKFLPQVAQANSILDSITGGKAGDQVWDFVKSLEMKGTTIDPARFAAYLNKMTQVVEATGGRVTPQQFFQAFRYGRTAMQGWDQSFVAGALPRLIQSMGGSGAGGRGGPGNALMSAFASVVQGQITKKAASEFARLGMAQSYRPIAGSAQAQIDVAGRALFEKNPYEWVQQVLMPKLAAAGITQQNDIIAEISRLFPNRTAGQVISEMALQGRAREGAQSQFEKDIKLQNKALAAMPSFQQLMNGDPVIRIKAFTASWNNLMQALGSTLVPVAIKVMTDLTAVFTKLGQIASAHPEAVKLVLEGIGALAAGLVVFGGVAMTAAIAAVAGLPAVIAAAVAGLAAALGALAAINWDAISSGIGKFVHAIAGLWEKIKSWFSKAGQEWTNAPFDPTSYTGGARLWPASFTTGGFSNFAGARGTISTNPAINGPITTNTGASGVPSHWRAQQVWSAVGGHTAAGSAPNLAGLAGNPYVKAARAGFAKELADPNKRLAFAAMLLSEGTPQPTAESAMNRSLYAHKTLMQMLHSGFYGPINRGHLPAFEARLRHNPALMAKMNRAINSALGGSDIIRGATDQGMPSDPNGRWPGGRMLYRGQVFNDWGGGPGGHAGAARWRHHFESHADDDGDAASAAIPNQHGGANITINHKSFLDGRVVAKSVHKHTARMGNMPSHSARMPDPYANMPLGI